MSTNVYFETFVYCWTDHVTQKLYVGVHKGRPDDGYICSSKYFLEEYNKRPFDFTRQIIAEGSDAEMRKLESKILEADNAALNEAYYNRHNANEKWYNQGGYIRGPHSQETLEKIRKSVSGFKHSKKVREKISKSLKGKQKSEITKKKMSEIAKNRSKEHWDKINAAKIGRTLSNDTKKKIGIESSKRMMIKHKCPYCEYENNKGNLAKHIRKFHKL